MAQAVRLSAIGSKLRKTAELSRLGTQALAGADKAVRASKRVSAAKATLGATKFGRGATRTRKALSPFSTKQRRLSFAANTVGGAVGASLAKDPRDWTAEDIAGIVAGGYINAAAGKRLSELLTAKGKMGPGSAAVIQNTLFGAGISASTQAAFNKGRVDWTKVGTGAAMGGFGGGVGRGSVRRRLDREGLSVTRKEALNFAGGAVAIPAGKRLADRDKKLRKDLASAGDGPDGVHVSNPDSPGLPSAPILHTIRPGETLSSISGDRLDDPEVWRRIREANPGLTDPDLIRPGDRVVIPGDLGFQVAD
ncbi:MAG: LysM peptidoglycan-binding domain-containing protein [Acidimicrobiia bacterium]|nr:LysM peptidoglycan-binding domain-containing protein [Acidimicrobiia bacterium]